MAGAPSSPRRRGPPAVAWILLLAVLVGVAAALLSHPVGPSGPAAPSLGPLTWSQVTGIITILVLVFLGLWLFFSLSGERVHLPSRAVATILVILLLGVLFVEVAGLVHIAPLPSSTNSTGNSTHSGGGSGLNSSQNNTTSLFGGHGITLPAWAGVAAIVGIAVLAGVLLVPYLVARAEDHRRDRGVPEGSARAAQRALQDALDRLNSADAADARATILALYARLLLLIGPRLGTLDSLTPGEIQRDSIESLGLRHDVAQDLTETFEEARYSTHPLTVDSVRRARAALAEAIVDLTPSPGATP